MITSEAGMANIKGTGPHTTNAGEEATAKGEGGSPPRQTVEEASRLPSSCGESNDER